MSRRMRVGRSRHVCAYEPVFNKAYTAARKAYTASLHDGNSELIAWEGLALKGLPRKKKKHVKILDKTEAKDDLIGLVPALHGTGGLYFPGFRDVDKAVDIWIRKNEEA